MEKFIYADVPETDREAMLESMCKATEEKLVKKHFTPEEITEFRKNLSDNHVLIRKAIEALNEAKKVYNDAVNEPIKENLKLVNNIRCGFVEINQQVYLFPDYELSTMNYYDRHGEFLQSRRLLPEEMQTAIR
jgi:hypothetical protein